MRRHAAAALAALFCLLFAPQVFAAHPTRPSRPAPRFASSQPRQRAARRMTSRGRGTVASNRRETSRRATRQASTRSVSPTHRTSATSARVSRRASLRSGRATRSKRHSPSQDDNSFVARSARAAAERRPRVRSLSHEDTEDDGAEIRSRVSQIQEATTNVVSLLPPPRTLSLYGSDGKLILPAPLRGSHEILLHQNEMADREGLVRVQDSDDLIDMRRSGKLVPLPSSSALLVDTRLPDDRRYSRPWTATFLAAMSRDFYAHFHEPLQVNSAVRTVSFQRRLGRTNGNAAPAVGDTASPHLTGQAVDIGKKGLSVAEIAWLRLYLQPLIEDGKVDVEEEFQQACFHISVYKTYMPAIANRITVAAQQTPERIEP